MRYGKPQCDCNLFCKRVQHLKCHEKCIIYFCSIKIYSYFMFEKFLLKFSLFH